MTTLLFILGIVLIAVTVRIGTRALVVPRLQLKAHLRELQDYGFVNPIGETDISLKERLGAAFRVCADRLGGYMMRRFPQLPALAKTDLSAAGFYNISEERVHGYRAMLAVAMPMTLYLLLVAGQPMKMTSVLLISLSIAGGWQTPSFIVRKRGTSRMDEIERQLPELLDLLIATIEAGMGFAAALKLIADRLDGPLGEELRLTMREQSLGMTISEALEAMAERAPTPSMRAFVRTAARGESLGVSIGPVMRELSADQRRRRRQAAREKMQKAPIKMIFPVMFLIFPALMIVLMYPAAWAVMKNLPGL
jgi:tight adherence protein C